MLIKDTTITSISKRSFIANYKDDLTLFAFLAVYLICWTVFSASQPLATELDNIEQVVWSQSWERGYYKHPPLPSALLHVLNTLFGGPSLLLNAFAAQSCSVIALIYIWLLAKYILPRKLAITAVLLTSLIAYHNYRALPFNHNTVSLPFTAAAIYYFYCALRIPERTANWLWLGIAGGLMLLTKYSGALVLSSIFVFITWQRLWTPVVIRGLLISGGLLLIVISPHIVWLVEHDWLPFIYLNDKLNISGNRFTIIGHFLGTQLLRLSLSLPLLLGIGYLRQKGTIKTIASPSLDSPAARYDQRFLLATLLTPLLLALLPVLLTGSKLNYNWASAFFLPAGILATQYFFQQCDGCQLLKYASRLAWLTQASILLFFIVATQVNPNALIGKKERLNFPSQALAYQVSEIWHEHQKQPLAIVIADLWSGGNMLLHIRPAPILFVDNNSHDYPWVDANEVKTCGAFILTTQTDILPENYAQLFRQASVTGEFVLQWNQSPQEQDLHYLWAIVPPMPDQTACNLT